MRYELRSEHRPTTNGLDGGIVVLMDTKSGARAEVWPALGFNCYRWQVGSAEVLYSAPNLFDDTRPTRSGIPVLFPFPNRIRDGAFTWNGQVYRLPLNDPTKKNAIHGFACRHPWRIVDQGGDNDRAWVTGEFQASKDAPEDAKLWPADYRIRLTITLGENRLRLAAQVDNPDARPLPFGLGYHPYFHTPLLPGASKEECLVHAAAKQYWELQENLPTGDLKPVDAARDLNQPRRINELNLDDVLQRTSGAPLGGVVQQGAGKQATLTVAGDAAFREVVVFTPVHRDAFCIEPYTCTTDAINLQARGMNAGWLTLEPGRTWKADIELTFAWR
jgi:aldose 1-epimerase